MIDLTFNQIFWPKFEAGFYSSRRNQSWTIRFRTTNCLSHFKYRDTHCDVTTLQQCVVRIYMLFTLLETLCFYLVKAYQRCLTQNCSLHSFIRISYVVEFQWFWTTFKKCPRPLEWQFKELIYIFVCVSSITMFTNLIWF